ncbi:penicillin-binding protein activator LpoA [Mixta theicola]|nr:penicillin-binding protein activator LpoA [Mixta theicola]
MPVLLAGLILAACTGQTPQAPSVNIQGPATGTSSYYLQQVQQSPDDNKADWQLLAIRALLNEGKYPQAYQQITQLPQQLSDTQRQELQLLTAQLRLGSQDFPSAQAILAKLNPSSMSKDQQQRYYGMKIAANQGRPSLDLVRMLIAQEPLLTDKAHQDNIDATWQTLTQLPPEQMSSLVINADENTLQGWLDLLNVYKANRTDPDMLKAGISDWQMRYPQNPAAKTPPTALGQVQNFQPASTGKIALLLPLSGQAQVFASAIQKGFNDAKNGLLNTQPSPAVGSAQNPVALPSDGAQNSAEPASNSANNSAEPANGSAQPQAANTDAVVSPSAAPADPDSSPPAAPPAASATTAPASNAEVKVYDTSSQPIQQIIAQAQQDGATLVVGPLLKDNVQQLADSSTPLNVLALNEPEKIQNHPNLCYFALSPEDEARDAAHHIWQQGKRMPLLLVPRSSLGDRVSKAFAQEWQTLGGSTVLQQGFGSAADLKQGINSGAGISLSGTPVTPPVSEPQGVTIAGLTIPAPQSSTPPETAASGGAVDAVYIVATQGELQLIKPMIAMRISSRSNVALYASSRSFQAGAGPDFRLEMEGLQFSDIPLLSGANPGLMQQAARSFNNDFSLVRLYAMGIDAWTLANHFSEMRQMSGFRIDGNTGQLSATENCVINRKLIWSQYRQGQVVPAS